MTECNEAHTGFGSMVLRIVALGAECNVFNVQSTYNSGDDRHRSQDEVANVLAALEKEQLLVSHMNKELVRYGRPTRVYVATDAGKAAAARFPN